MVGGIANVATTVERYSGWNIERRPTMTESLCTNCIYWDRAFVNWGMALCGWPPNDVEADSFYLHTKFKTADDTCEHFVGPGGEAEDALD